MKTDRQVVTVHTDGGCVPNPGVGGWGAVLENTNGFFKELYGAKAESTNNQMEIQACIEAIAFLDRPYQVNLNTDSIYVVETMKGRYRRKKNHDLWKKLDEVIHDGDHVVNWQWVRGHNGNPGNERAHELAQLGIYELMEGVADGN